MQGKTEKCQAWLQCQDIAASERRDDYSPYTGPREGIKPELDTYVMCTDTEVCEALHRRQTTSSYSWAWGEGEKKLPRSHQKLSETGHCAETNGQNVVLWAWQTIQLISFKCHTDVTGIWVIPQGLEIVSQPTFSGSKYILKYTASLFSPGSDLYIFLDVRCFRCLDVQFCKGKKNKLNSSFLLHFPQLFFLVSFS